MKRTLSAGHTMRTGYLLRTMTIGAFWMGCAGCGPQAPREPEGKSQTTAQQELRGAGASGNRIAVPFVGCPTDGQAGPIDPPTATFKVVAEKRSVTSEIAYYKGSQGPGVYAPKGGYCQESYGSAGTRLLVSFTPIDRAKIRDNAVMAICRADLTLLS